MTGDKIRLLLEQQFVGCGGQRTARILQISAGFSYESAMPSAAACADKVGDQAQRRAGRRGRRPTA